MQMQDPTFMERRRRMGKNACTEEKPACLRTEGRTSTGGDLVIEHRQSREHMRPANI